MGIGSFNLPLQVVTPEETWSRPGDWVSLPTVTSVEEKFVGLHAIHPEGNNFVAFIFTTSSGQYRVNWGDGTETLYDSGVLAEYDYNYDTYDVGNTTLSTFGYKQAIITVTPVSGNLLTANFQQRYTGQAVAYTTGFLDCILSMPNHSASAIAFGGTTVRHALLECFDVKTLGSCNSLVSMFQNCYKLMYVPLFDTSLVTLMTSFFQSCYSITSVPLFNTSSVTNMTSMFQTCPSLTSVPLFDSGLVTDMMSMFSGCSSIKTIPLFNTASVLTMQGMFQTCTLLSSIPLFNTASVTNMSSMFNGCVGLRSIPLFNTSAVTNMATMFAGCFLLINIPLFNTALVTNMSTIFSACQSLVYIPALSTASITIGSGSDFNTSFANNCNSLRGCDMIFARTVTISNGLLSKEVIEEIFTKLIPRTSTSATIALTGNYGLGTTVAKTGTTSAGNVTITMTNTASLEVGMQVIGTGTPLTTALAISFNGTFNIVQAPGHGLQNGDMISFATITSSIGLSVHTIYYVVNKNNDDFQLSETPSGAVIDLTNSASGTMRYICFIESIITNTSVTMTREMTSGSVNSSLTFRHLKTGIALLKNWVVTG